jgi:hypothetical protein
MRDFIVCLYSRKQVPAGWWNAEASSFAFTPNLATRYTEREATDRAAALRLRGLKVGVQHVGEVSDLTRALEQMPEDEVLALLERKTRPEGQA